MVRGLHAAGLEVILDVVYNQPPKGITSGPRSRSKHRQRLVLRLVADDRRYYMDFTGAATR